PHRKDLVVPAPEAPEPSRLEALYGADTFSRQVMQKRLPKAIYKSLVRTMDHGEPLDPQVADIVAATMKDWAVERGATHYTHWFQPLTGLTAEKHDSLISPDGTDRKSTRLNSVT